MKKCPSCRGCGQCYFCNGQGINKNGRCGRCDGARRCKRCNGGGKITVAEIEKSRMIPGNEEPLKGDVLLQLGIMFTIFSLFLIFFFVGIFFLPFAIVFTCGALVAIYYRNQNFLLFIRKLILIHHTEFIIALDFGIDFLNLLKYYYT